MTDQRDVSPAATPSPGDDPPGAEDGPSVGEQARRPHEWAALAGFAAITAATAVAGALVGPRRPSTMRWYRSLDKPPYQPPAALFGPVWTGLYATIAVSGWRVWRQPDSPSRSRALRLWGAQMTANAAWTPLFFGARRTSLALVDLAAQLSSTIGYTSAAARVDTPAATLMAPYIGWTAFAGVLNTEIVRRNS